MFDFERQCNNFGDYYSPSTGYVIDDVSYFTAELALAVLEGEKFGFTYAEAMHYLQQLRRPCESRFRKERVM